MTRRLYRPEEAAVILNRSPERIRADLRSGRIRGRKVGKGRGHWRVLASEVEKVGKEGG